MNKVLSKGTFAALALALAAPACRPAIAQSETRRDVAPAAMSASDRAALHARQGELATAVKIYGYNLAEGNWTYEQTLCAPLPRTILLHYRRHFPDGTESSFSALVPRVAGHVRIVPLLYHGATPFQPAPKNPRNYAVFNSLVPPMIGYRNAAARIDWLDLGACYAEMTGGSADLSSARGEKSGIAGEPSPTVRLDLHAQTAHVIFAERDSQHTYKLWGISFNKKGEVTAAATGEESVYAAKTPQLRQLAESRPASLPQNRPAITQSSSRPQIPTESTAQAAQLQPQPQPEITAPTAQPERAAEAVTQPGWKPILNPKQPPSKFAPAPPPPAGESDSGAV